MNNSEIVLGKFRKCYPVNLSNKSESISNNINDPSFLTNDIHEENNLSNKFQNSILKFITEIDSFHDNPYQNDNSSYSKIG